MHVVVGLGNPGAEYVHTRHNIGFTVVEALAVALSARFSFNKKLQAEVAHVDVQASGDELYLIKPQTFMNKSGESVRSLYEYYGAGKPSAAQLQNLFVVLDDLDIQLGKYKVQLAKGPKVHNGLTSIYQHVGSPNFYHVRVGIENRGELRRSIPGDRYVLSKFSTHEADILHGVTSQLVQELLKQLKVR